MVREPSRRGLLTVRAVKAAATTAAVGSAMVLTLGGAIASSADPERVASDTRCAGASGKTIVRTFEGATRVVSFEHGWKVYRGERPGTLVVVCPS